MILVSKLKGMLFSKTICSSVFEKLAVSSAKTQTKNPQFSKIVYREFLKILRSALNDTSHEIQNVLPEILKIVLKRHFFQKCIAFLKNTWCFKGAFKKWREVWNCFAFQKLFVWKGAKVKKILQIAQKCEIWNPFIQQ